MTVKTIGAEFKRFYSDDSIWLTGMYHEDEEVTINGDQCIDFDYKNTPDDAVVTVSGGVVCGPQFDENEPSLETFFKRWRKAQTTASFVVECDLAKLDAVKAAIQTAGGRVI